MKAITLWQPWASAIPLGLKRFETRSWGTNYRGPLAIHAAKQIHVEGAGAFLGIPDCRYEMAEHGYNYLRDLPFGLVLATCTLVDCIPITPAFIADNISEQERSYGDYTVGRYAWKLENIVPLDVPIPARGKQRLWEWNYEL